MSRIVKLGDVLKYEQPTKYIVSDNTYNDNYDIPVLTAGKTFILGYTNETENIFTKVPVIIFDDFTTSSKFVDFPFKVKSSAMKILNPTEDIDIKYIFYLMSTIKSDKGLHKRYWISKYAKMNISLPPLEKQKQIVKTLDKAQELITLRKESISKLDELSKSLFIDMFGDPVSNPKNLNHYILDELSTRVTDGEHQTPKRSESGTFLLSARNIQQSYIDVINEKVDYVQDLEVDRIEKRLKIEKNDILLSCSGTIGRVSLNTLKEKFCLVRSVAVIKPILEKINPVYLVSYLQTNYMQMNMNRDANSSGQPNLFQNQIKKLKIYLPSLEEQNNFAKKIEKIEEQKELYTKELEKLQYNFDALLAKSFQG